MLLPYVPGPLRLHWDLIQTFQGKSSRTPALELPGPLTPAESEFGSALVICPRLHIHIFLDMNDNVKSQVIFNSISDYDIVHVVKSKFPS